MFSRNAITLLMTGLMVLLAGAAVAGIPDPDNSSFTAAVAEDVSILICPNGDGDLFSGAQAFNQGPGTADATITVTLLDINFVPVVNYPREDVWLQANGLCYCPDGNIVDANTDANGMTSFILPMRAAGCSDDGSSVVWVNGDAINNLPLAHLKYNSPDMNCDLVVNLTDIVFFSQVYYGAYDYCADFYWDGAINLSDIVFLAQHNSHACP